MVIFGLKNCDTCKKALRALPGAKLHDVRENPLEHTELERFFAAFGDALINRKSTTWRGLSEAERARDPIVLLGAHPTLMKRPVIEGKQGLFLGWGEETRKVLL